jgi:hypothetical protein
MGKLVLDVADDEVRLEETMRQAPNSPLFE